MTGFYMITASVMKELSYWAIKFRLYTEKTIETVKSMLLFKKIANFKGKLLENYK